MKRLSIVLGLLFIASPLYADDELVEPQPVDVIDLITKAENNLLAPANEPFNFWNTAVDIIGRSDFSLELNHDLASDDQFGSASVSVFDFAPEHKISSLRFGIGKEKRFFGSIALNYPNIIGSILPDAAKNNAFFSPETWTKIGNITYTHIGFGYKGEAQGDESDWILPIGFGISARF